MKAKNQFAILKFPLRRKVDTHHVNQSINQSRTGVEVILSWGWSLAVDWLIVLKIQIGWVTCWCQLLQPASSLFWLFLEVLVISSSASSYSPLICHSVNKSTSVWVVDTVVCAAPDGRKEGRKEATFSCLYTTAVFSFIISNFPGFSFLVIKFCFPRWEDHYDGLHNQ